MLGWVLTEQVYNLNINILCVDESGYPEKTLSCPKTILHVHVKDKVKFLATQWSTCKSYSFDDQ